MTPEQERKLDNLLDFILSDDSPMAASDWDAVEEFDKAIAEGKRRVQEASRLKGDKE